MSSGLTLPIEPILIALNLEARGFRLGVSPDGATLLVSPGDEPLTDADREAIRRWKRHLIAIVSCDPPTRVQ